VTETDEEALALVRELNDRAMRAWDAADWEAYRGLHTEDLVVVDHRPASLGSIQGRETYLDATRVMREMFVAANTGIVEQHRLFAHGSVAQTSITCVSDTGLEVAVETVTLNTIRDGRMDRIEFFPVEQLEEALARFDDLGRGADERA